MVPRAAERGEAGCPQRRGPRGRREPTVSLPRDVHHGEPMQRDTTLVTAVRSEIVAWCTAPARGSSPPEALLERIGHAGPAAATETVLQPSYPPRTKGFARVPRVAFVPAGMRVCIRIKRAGTRCLRILFRPAWVVQEPASSRSRQASLPLRIGLSRARSRAVLPSPSRAPARPEGASCHRQGEELALDRPGPRDRQEQRRRLSQTASPKRSAQDAAPTGLYP